MDNEDSSQSLKRQEGGTHYKGLLIQPIEYMFYNNLGALEGKVVKYITRWKDKGGVQDLKKAKHVIELLIEMTENPRFKHD